MYHRLLAILIVLFSLTWPASLVKAGGVVNICDETHLKAALAGGGELTFSCSGTILLTSTITIAVDTTIDGSGQEVTISGDNAVRVFDVNPGTTLNLIELTVVNGKGDFGGGIRNYGTLTVSKSTFSGNFALEAGGGIYNRDGTLTVSNSTFSNNNGEGIHNRDSILTVSNSTFSDNSGGGILNWNGILTVSNSTFSGNFASHHSDSGGGISNIGTLTVSNSTFSNNSGGGIHNYGGTTNLGNTIVANSTGGNCQGTITDLDGNLTFGDHTCPGIYNDPLLGPLQDNGGPTHTMALSPGSPAIDAAVASICAASPVNNQDQRGEPRPVDGDGDGKAICDIGAFEDQPRWIYLPLVWKE